MSEIEVGSVWRSDDSGLVATGERVKVVGVARYSFRVEAMDGELKGERFSLDRAWFLKKFSPVAPADAPPAAPPHGPVKTFASGAVRSMDGESVRYDLVSPIGLRRLAETYAEGAEQYTVGNWLKGIPASNLLNRLLRHVDLYRSGDRDEDHLAHAAWGLFALMHFEETRPDLMDLVDFAGNGGGK